MTRLVCGLGNPGPEYAWTPHNVGFHAVEYLARREGLLFESTATLDGYVGPPELRVARSFEPDAALAMPLTYMNRSGIVVAPLARSLGADPADVLVVVDDLDLPLGRLRIRPHGGTGGHRGLQSIVDELGTDRFPRLRVGVGRPATDAARHVLAPFPPEDRLMVERVLAEAADALWTWSSGEDLEKCMTRFHSRWKQGIAPEAAPARDAAGPAGNRKEAREDS